MKIIHKLFLGYALIALVAAFAGYFIITHSQQVLKQSIGEDSVLLAEQLMRNIDGKIHSKIEGLQLYARDSVLTAQVEKSNLKFVQLHDIEGFIRQKDREWVSAPKGSMTPFMQDITDNSLARELKDIVVFYMEHEGRKGFSEIYVTNRYGAVIAATGRTSDYFQADEVWYQEAVAEENYWVGDVEYDESSSSYACDIVIKLFDDSGNFSGILKGVLNIEEIISLIKQAEVSEQAHKEHRTMQVKLLTRDGRVIYSSEEFVLFEQLSERFMALLRNGHSDYVVAMGDKAGEGDELIAHHHSRGYQDFHGLGWFLVIEHEAEEIFRPVVELRNFIIVIILIVITISIFIGSFLSHAIAHPIEHFRNVARRIGSGDFTSRVDIESNDEIGELALDFNRMVDDLSEITVSRDELLKEITERKQLEERLKQALVVFEESNEAILITDKRGHIVAVNRAFTEMNGYLEDEVLGRNPEFMKSEQHDQDFYRSMWRAIRKKGKWHGEVVNRRKNGEVYPAWLNVCTVMDEEGDVTQYVAVFSDIGDIKHSQERLNHAEYHDPLTNLPNRQLLNDRLEHAFECARRDEKKVAVLFLDLDRFKQINDTLGYLIGDHLLQQVAERLTSLMREDDSLGRLVGDEFLMIMEGLSKPQDAAILAQKILDTFKTPFNVDDHELFMTTSIGISIYPDNGDTVNVQVTNADVAMYSAKEEGNNSYLFYSPKLTQIAIERSNLESQLRYALARDELHLCYQPQVSFETGEIIGAEALVRWEHPEMGMVSPGKFIEIAENCGLIIPIGEWVLRTACREMAAWRSAGYPLKKIAVNVAGPQIKRSDLVGLVRTTLDESGLDPECLELEVTEGFIMDDPEHSIDLLNRLKALGVGLAIDDFGTGHSCLSYLKQFPIDKLKIDRSFVMNIPDNLDDKAIAHAVIALGKAMNLKVIAEGVEIGEQQNFLHSAGCDEGQGYLYSKPVIAEEFIKLLKQS